WRKFVRIRGGAKNGVEFERRGTAARVVTLLHQKNAQTGAREHNRGNQPLGAGADNGRLVTNHGPVAPTRTHTRRKNLPGSARDDFKPIANVRGEKKKQERCAATFTFFG